MNLFKHSQYLLHVKGFEKMMIISGTYMKKTESLFIQQKKSEQISAFKESSVRNPRAWGFCYQASELTVFNSPMGREVLLGIQITEEFAINPAHKNVFLGTNWNNFWANTSKIQVAQMSSCKTDFPCSQLDI